MYNKILVPIGDSKNTPQAIANAIFLAEEFSGEITCLYVSDEEKLRSVYFASYQPPELPGPPGQFYDADILAEIREALDREENVAETYFNYWKEKNPHISMKYEYSQGIVWQEILNYAKDADIIVIGKTVFKDEDKGGLNPGGVLREVAHKSLLPVICCSDGHKIAPNFMIAYDGRNPSRRALNDAMEMAKHFKKPLYILTVDNNSEKANRISREAATIAVNSGVEAIETTIIDTETPSVIITEMERLDVNFLFMGAYGHGQIMDVLLGSTTDGVLKKTGCATLLRR